MIVHFTGIKGVGMTALALAYQDRGFRVQGSDTTETQITDAPLKERNIKVFERFTPRNISKIVNSKWVPVINKLVYTGAHHGRQNVEPKWAASRGIEPINYAEALGEFFSDKKQVCVCGVGGKTTTTAMLATILYHAGAKPSWVMGVSSIPSLPAPGKWDDESEWAVIEADEYVADPTGDKTPKMMYLNPKVIICTNIEHDHPDIYPCLIDVVKQYVEFFKKLPKNGILIISEEALEKITNYFDSELKMLKDRGIKIVLLSNYKRDSKLKKLIRVPGEHHLWDAVAAIRAAEEIGLAKKDALRALKKFTGTKRRFEHLSTIGKVELYDDYAHHPLEIVAVTKTAREFFPSGSRLRIIFHPHTYSRTKALFDGFAESLGQADEVILFPIFASAREEKDPSVSSELLAGEIIKRGGNAKFIGDMEKLVKYLCQTAKSGDVIMTMGAGDVYKLHDHLKKCLKQRKDRKAKK